MSERNFCPTSSRPHTSERKPPKDCHKNFSNSSSDVEDTEVYTLTSGRPRKTLLEHQKDIEHIVKAKGGEIMKGEWRPYGKHGRTAPFFEIRCNKNHLFSIYKHHLMPKKNNPNGSWCTAPDCRGKSLEDHQKDIEHIVKAKGGEIIKKEWRPFSKDKRFAPFFEIRCNKNHLFWVVKQGLFQGHWCTAPDCRGKSLEDHQKDIEHIVKAKGGEIIKKEWRKYSGKFSPFFEIRCNKDHEWWVLKGSIRASHWCPRCSQHYCELIMRQIVEKLFNTKCEQTTLKDAFGLLWEEEGKLRFDGFIKIKINGIIVPIAFEYDGIQHDVYPNHWHKTRDEFEKLQKSDTSKREIIKKNKAILICLKAKDGFDKKTIKKFPKEIVRQFNKAMKEHGIDFRLKGL